jgi:hypothetical protein
MGSWLFPVWKMADYIFSGPRFAKMWWISFRWLFKIERFERLSSYLAEVLLYE